MVVRDRRGSCPVSGGVSCAVVEPARNSEQDRDDQKRHNDPRDDGQTQYFVPGHPNRRAPRSDRSCARSIDPG
jgi:hypothetical protein